MKKAEKKNGTTEVHIQLPASLVKALLKLKEKRSRAEKGTA